jgi:hypothetical protein
MMSQRSGGACMRQERSVEANRLPVFAVSLTRRVCRSILRPESTTLMEYGVAKIETEWIAIFYRAAQREVYRGICHQYGGGQACLYAS